MTDRVTLHNYQVQAIADIEAAFLRHRRVLLQMPTGSGKTLTAREFIHRRMSRGPVWFLCHKREIISQTAAAFRAAGFEFGVIAPAASIPDGEVFDPRRRLQIGSIQTLHNRVKHFDKAPALIVWDEAHHAAARTWRGLMEKYAAAEHLGLTATPERLDGRGLDDLFEYMVKGPSIRELIDGGYLARPRWFAPSEPDLTKARIQAGDFLKSDLAEIMDKPVIIGDALDHYRRELDGKRALAFCASVDASQKLVAMFEAAGIPAAHIDAKTPASDRAEALRGIEVGKIKVLSNVDVFTEGLDVPVVDGVILLRPTMSPALFFQMVGRGLRMAKGKTEAVVLDHAALVTTHGLITDQWDWSLSGTASRNHLIALAENDAQPFICSACGFVGGYDDKICPNCHSSAPSRTPVRTYAGVLREILCLPPDGYSTVCALARTLGCLKPSLRNTIADLIENGFVNVEKAMERINERAPRYVRPRNDDQSRYVRVPTFADELGVPVSTVNALIKRGMPVTKNRWVDRELGLKWIRDNPISHMRPILIPARDGYVSKGVFAKEIGVSHTMVSKFVEDGMPSSDNGWINRSLAMAWLRLNTDKYPSLRKIAAKHDGYEQKIAFRRRTGISESTMKTLIKHGLHCNSDGLVHIADGISLLEEWRNRQRPEPTHGVTETKKAFAFRIGVHPRTVTDWSKAGLPTNEHGHVLIQDGLEWASRNYNKKLSLSQKESWSKRIDNTGEHHA